jgi:hypothetical protein
MSFFRRFFGQSAQSEAPADRRGIYVYAACDRCGQRLRIRIDRQYDLNQRDEGGYDWHKTLVDSRCFRPMPTMVTFDQHYRIISAEIEGGHYMSQEAYEAAERSAALEEE